MMRRSAVIGFDFATVVTVCICLMIGAAARAATISWNGGSTGTWSTTNTNWNTATAIPWDATTGITNVANLSGTGYTYNVSGTVHANGILFPVNGTVGGTGTVTLGGSNPEISASTSSAVINAVVAGSPFRKVGAGTLTLSGTNTLSAGTVTVGTGSSTTAAGYLRLQSDSALGSVTRISLPNTNTATGGVQLQGGVSTPSTLGITTAGRSNATTTGYILKNNSGDNAWNGSLTINAAGGSYGFVSDAGTLTLAGELTVSYVTTNRPVSFSGAGDFLVSGNIVKSGSNGDMSVAKNDAGTLTFSGANTYGGGTTVNGGRIVANSDTAFGTGGLTVNDGATQVGVPAGRSIANAVTINGGTGTIGQGLIQATGTGTATLAGTITINGGPASGAHFGSTSAATLAITGPVNSASTTIGVRTGTVVFQGGGTYSAIDLGEGTVRLGATDGLSTAAEFQFSNANNGGGNLDLAGFDQQLTGLVKTGGTTGTNRVGNSSTTSDSTLTTTGTSSFSGIIQDALGGGTRQVSLVVAGGSLTLTGASTFTGDTRVSAGSLVLGNASAIGGSTFDTQSGSVGTLSFGTLTTATFGGLEGSNDLNLDNAAPAAVGLSVGGNNASTTYAGGLTGGGSLTKVGTGTLTLTGASSHAGGTRIGAGTLLLSGGNDRLPAAGTVGFTGSGTLDVGATSQTLAGLTTPSGGQFSLALAGAGGSLAISGGDSLEIGPGGVVTAGQRVTMDMANLSSFSYSSGSGTFRVGLKGTATNQSGTVPGTSSVRLADATTITTPLLGIGDRPGTSDGGDAAMTLGQTTAINATDIDQGTPRSNAVMEFAAGLATPAVTIRGADGVSPVNRWRVGMTQTNPSFVRTSFTTAADFSAGTLDASVTSLVIGAADSETQSNRAGTQTATFTMGAGTLTVGTLTVGQIAGAGSLGGTYAANGTLTIGAPGGLVSATSLRLAENTITATGSVTKAVSGTVNLAAGTLRAGSIALGPQTGSATAVTTAFNWTGGTIENAPAADLLVDTVPLTLVSGVGTFQAGGSNTITVNAGSPISGSGGLVKTGTGRLVLAGTNTYAGPTAVNVGTLLINGDQSAAAGAVTVAAAAWLAGTGTVGGAATISGIHSPGASPGLQTFTNGLAYASSGTLVWELSANTDLAGDRGMLYDGVNLTTGGSLAIASAATLSLVFDAPLLDSTPSTVVWSNPFWNIDRRWTIVRVDSPVTWDGAVFGTVTVGVDSLGSSLAAVRPNASFRVVPDEGDLVLEYVAVPEPAGFGIPAVVSVVAWVVAVRRRRRA